jgi:hypothetical protein
MEAAAEERRAFKHMIWPGVLLGIWLVVSPFVLNYTRVPAAMWNSIAVGFVVALTALARGTGRAYKQTGCNWLNVFSAIWLIISPFILGFSKQLRPLWNDVILGVLVGLSVLIHTLRSSMS